MSTSTYLVIARHGHTVTGRHYPHHMQWSLRCHCCWHTTVGGDRQRAESVARAHLDDHADDDACRCSGTDQHLPSCGGTCG